MYHDLKLMESKLSAQDKKRLKSIYAPQVVTIPPMDANRNMCVTPDGEIRIYGAENKVEPNDIGTLVYIASNDCGLSWKTHYMPENALGAAGYSKVTGRYISTYPNENRRDLIQSFGKSGTWAILNDEGYNSANNRFVKISESNVHILKVPVYMESCNRWFIFGEYVDYSEKPDKFIAVFYSDDNGESWAEVSITEPAPKFEIKPPHLGTRWQQWSKEPTIVELSNGDLLMFTRTSQNYYYMYRSSDKGESWSKPEQTNFHGTITMPVLEKLSDGRILFFGCNTQPMPELDLHSVFPPLPESIKSGIWEDVFTNRDANHLSISEDDGKTWIGLRELYLNDVRNYADFRSVGGVDSRDKSVHQAQMIELPYNKVLIHFGQNTISRKAVILDVNWLYETERAEDFRLGIQNVSTQMYVKSNLGGYRGFSGHCAYNRTDGALLVLDPDGNYEEALQICRTEDSRLAYQKQGVVWNFPTSMKGTVEVKLKVLESGVNIALTDRWYNPCDETIADEAHILVPVTEKTNDWVTVKIKYDLTANVVDITVGDKNYQKDICFDAPLGLNYLHIQTLAEEQDYEGTLIKSFKKTV
ncbi:MAG: exo-alpha-sialidase [Clostridia bacterium]|nr:exo-alpha-sialidase [Clostridia bacterium]